MNLTQNKLRRLISEEINNLNEAEGAEEAYWKTRGGPSTQQGKLTARANELLQKILDELQKRPAVLGPELPE